MASTQLFFEGELPAQYQPYGYEWLRLRLLAVGYTGVHVFEAPTPGQTYVTVDQNGVSKSQLQFDAQPTDGLLSANYTILNVPPTFTMAVTITGPVGKTVKVRFDGVLFVSETEFVLPINNNYELVLGPCPAEQRVVTPQLVDFYVEDGSCSPVAIKVTFK